MSWSHSAVIITIKMMFTYSINNKSWFWIIRIDFYCLLVWLPWLTESAFNVCCKLYFQKWLFLICPLAKWIHFNQFVWIKFDENVNVKKNLSICCSCKSELWTIAGTLRPILFYFPCWPYSKVYYNDVSQSAINDRKCFIAVNRSCYGNGRFNCWRKHVQQLTQTLIKEKLNPWKQKSIEWKCDMLSWYVSKIKWFKKQKDFFSGKEMIYILNSFTFSYFFPNISLKFVKEFSSWTRKYNLNLISENYNKKLLIFLHL